MGLLQFSLLLKLYTRFLFSRFFKSEWRKVNPAFVMATYAT